MTEMSIVLPYGFRHIPDRLAPSKALQEAKEKLGPAFFEAKLVECPKNAIELTKLMKHCDELDNRRFKIIQESKRNKRVLLHTMQSRYTFSKASTTMANNPAVKDIKLPPPGFRFHANGEPKLSLIKSVPNCRTPGLVTSTIQKADSCEDTVLKSVHIHHPTPSPIPTDIKQRVKSAIQSEIEEIVRVEDSNNTLSSLVGGYENNKSENQDDYCEKEMKEIEKLIREIDTDLSKNKIHSQSTGNAREKALCFLRAHTRGEKALLLSVSEPTKFSRPNDRFPFQPGSSSFVHHDKKVINRKPESDKRRVVSHSSCTACQYKLKHNSDDFHKLTEKLSKVHFKRWNFAPRGKLIERPSSSPRLETNTPRSSHMVSPERIKSPESKGVKFSTHEFAQEDESEMENTDSMLLRRPPVAHTSPRKAKSADRSFMSRWNRVKLDDHKNSGSFFNTRSACTVSSSHDGPSADSTPEFRIASPSWREKMEEEKEISDRKVKEFIKSLDNLIEKKPKPNCW